MVAHCEGDILSTLLEDVVAHWCRCCSLMVDMDGGSL